MVLKESEYSETTIRLKGLELFIQLTLIDGIIAIRTYQVKLLKSGLDQPRVELESIGPGIFSNFLSIHHFRSISRYGLGAEKNAIWFRRINEESNEGTTGS